MKEARIDASAKRARIALSLGDSLLAHALTAELALAADLEPVEAFDLPEILVTDGGEMPSDEAAAIVFIRRRGRSPPERGVRALLPDDLDPRLMIDALRLVAAGLVVLPGEEAFELDGPKVGETFMAPHLTAREREVLDLLAVGASNKEIARRLAISVHTVKFHIASLLAKLGASSRLDAVGIGLRTGLVMV